MLALTGVSHKTAPLEIRERLALDAQETLDVLEGLQNANVACILLSTCNRTELYVSGPDATEVSLAATHDLAARRGLTLTGHDGVFYTLQGDAAVRHLYRVAAGLESLVVGEDQILGQVRSALTLARRSHTADALLARLFETAVSAGRQARSGRRRSPVSVSAAAVDLALSLTTNVPERSVLVVSTGEAGTLTARSLLERGVERVTLVGRTPSRARKVASELGVSAASLQALPEALSTADVAISATGARGYLIDVPMLTTVMHARADRPLLLIDIAVPRDISPSVAGLPGVTLHDLDALQHPGDHCCSQTGLKEPPYDVLDSAVDAFARWMRSRQIVPTIAELRQHAERIRKSELQKTLARLPALDGEERRRIDALTAAIVNKLLHQPIVSLKESDGSPDYLDTVRDLFALPTSLE